MGALFIRDGVALPKLLHGGGQESGRRAGTECVVLQAALGKACQIAASEMVPLRAHMAECTNRLRAALVAGLGESNVRVNGPAAAEHRLPNTLSIGVRPCLLAHCLHTIDHTSTSRRDAARAVPFAVGLPVQQIVQPCQQLFEPRPLAAAAATYPAR